MNFWKWSGESRCPGALSPLLENFRPAFPPDLTDCPWVSEDDTPTVFTMKPKINLKNIGQGINLQLLNGRVSELKELLKQIGEEPWIEEGHPQSVTYLLSLERSSLFYCWFCCCCVGTIYAKRQKTVLSLIPYVPNSPPLLSYNLIDWKQLRADRINTNSL